MGFALFGWVDEAPHLAEMDVLPEHGRRGIGRALVQAAIAWARRQGGGSLSLTTFRDLPWNGPFYASLGFVALAGGELGSGLRAQLEREAEAGLARERRVAMRLPLPPG